MEYTLRDLMMIFDIKERTVRRHIKEGKLSGRKYNGVWHFNDSSIENYFQNPNFIKQRRKKQINKIIDYMNGFSESKENAIILINKFNMSHKKMQDIVNYVTSFDSPFKIDVEKLTNAYGFILETSSSNIKKFIEIIEDNNK